ncbi:cytochrome P450 [Acrocarpospora phusangensis]|uniref:Cytochrome P450 n=1 Tax=Acrocarpospora phusangensis TaxID=1070424 RepID=A0A919QAK4_9ACTN|nr:cytochrome P450 [Acrocarpospora phusangensis]GIH25286.1 cytochrome P450 [Acrocarpospora phusangensis]
MGVRPSFWEDPYPTYQAIASGSPVVRDEGMGVWIVTGRREATAILRSPHVSSRWDLLHRTEQADVLRRMLGGWFMLMDPPDHTRLRRAVQGWFTRRRIEVLRADLRRDADELLRGTSGDRVDVMGGFAEPLAQRMISRVLGIPLEHGVRAARLMPPIAGFLAMPHSRRFEAAAAEAAEELNRLFRGCADALTPDGLLAALAAERGPDALFADTAILLVFAGQETTAGLIGAGLLHLLRDRAAWGKLLRHEVTVEKAVEEILRFDTSVPQVPRIATADVAAGGELIRAGDRIVVILGAANRDPRVTADPDLLDLSRAPSHLAFGTGIHHCLGAPIARMTAQVAISAWLSSLPRARVVNGSVRWSADRGYRKLARACVLRTPEHDHPPEGPAHEP